MSICMVCETEFDDGVNGLTSGCENCNGGYPKKNKRAVEMKATSKARTNKKPLEDCPNCGSQYIESNIGEMEQDEGLITLEIWCPNCNRNFKETWKFVRWEEDED